MTNQLQQEDLTIKSNASLFNNKAFLVNSIGSNALSHGFESKFNMFMLYCYYNWDRDDGPSSLPD